jgi:hypothetical protein
MKHLLIAIGLLTYTYVSFGQNTQYQATMTDLASKIQNTHGTGFMPHANTMERIAAAETKEWLPQYWVAYCLINESFSLQEPAQRDMLLEKAQEFVTKAETLNKENAEIMILKAQYAQAKLSIDPMSRWEKYGASFEAALENAKTVEPQNPRIPYLMGTNLFYTPEGFGGGKNAAKPYFMKAKELFDSYQTKEAYAPSWGKAEIAYFLKQCE